MTTSSSNASAPVNPGPASDVGNFESSAVASSSFGPSTRSLTRAPQHDLDDFLTRWVQVQTLALTDTGSVVALLNFQPWALFLANAKVQDKVRNYALLRGDLDVLVTSAFPPGAFGRYEVSAAPVGGKANHLDNQLASAALVATVNCRQVDIHETIDAAASQDVILTLPYFAPISYYENPVSTAPTGAFDQTGMWIVTVNQLVPV